MNTRSIHRFIVLVTLALVAPAGFSQQRAESQKLPNFHDVNGKLYRAAQPKPGGLKELAALGIRTIVNLRGPGEGVRAEELEATAAGLRFFNIPFDRAGPPNTADIKKVLDIIDTPEYQPVLIHCQQGADRTGTVIAIYRITHDGWTSEQAKAEANRYGMHPWERGMKNYIHDYYLRYIQEKQAAAH
jgi:tyrosine-protein phosphatase SIW14